MDKYAYHRHLNKNSAGATYDDLNDEQVPKNHQLTVHHLSVENDTTAYTRLVVGISNGGNFHKLIEEDAPAADNIYWHDRPIYVPEGWFIRIRMTGNTSGDVCNAYINGVMEKVG